MTNMNYTEVVQYFRDFSLDNFEYQND